MLKHLEDDGDLTLLIDDAGNLLVACSKKHYWVGQMTPKEEASAAVVRSLADSLSEHPAMMADAAIDPDALQP